MRHRVYVVAAEYSAPLAILGNTALESYRQGPNAATTDADAAEFERVVFTAPPPGQGWADLGVTSAPTLTHLIASAAHRALGALHRLTSGSSYADTCWSISDLLVTSMPLLGAAPGSVNTGLIPQMLRQILGLDFDCHCQFVSGTSDTGANAFAAATRIAQSRPATILVTAGQMIPYGYRGQYRIRSVFAEDEQERGLDMMAMGDALMDALRRSQAPARFDRERALAWLEEVRERKLAAACGYPAALGTAAPPASATPRLDDSAEESSQRFVTRYFRAGDVARAGCGAAAVVLTSDPALLETISTGTCQHAPSRYQNMPAVEVVGVGEGNTNPRVLARQSPLVSVAAIRQALATAADDADLPMSVFADSAFGILDDAFPSMELAFLLAMGLDWQRATLRMSSWWSNPYGGLLAFGYAVGASGLVQICKAFHVFAGDRRYVRADAPVHRFRRDGAFALTSSIGGPLSHAVVSILRGGIPCSPADRDHFFRDLTRPDVRRRARAGAEYNRREKLRESVRIYVERLAAHRPGLAMIEGATEIDVRSCAQALSPEVINALELERLGTIVREDAFEACREQVRALILTLRTDYHAAADMLEHLAARERYNQGLASLFETWAEQGMLRASQAPLGDPAANAARAERQQLKALKQCVRAPVLFLIAPPRAPSQPSSDLGQASFASHLPVRGLHYLPDLSGVDEADFVHPQRDSGDVALSAAPDLLPWWDLRALRPEGAPFTTERLAGADAEQVFATLAAPRTLGDERLSELTFLRAYFAPWGPQAAVDLAIRSLGVGPEVEGERGGGDLVPALFYKNDIIGSSHIRDVHEAYELLGRAIQRARGWLGMYASTCAQHGDSVSLVSLDRRLDPTATDAENARREAISNASRFARDAAEWCLGYNIRLRTVVSFGHGVPYLDVNDDRSVASDSAIRGARLLDYVSREARVHGFAEQPWIVFDWTELVDVDDPAGRFARELVTASGSHWRQPDAPTSPVALERWEHVHFTVWYRPANCDA